MLPSWITPAVVVSLAITFLLVVLLNFAIARTISYIESIDVAAPIAVVYDSIRFQEKLMQWSAWPEATATTCRAEGPSGQVGAKTIYLRRDTPCGHQTVVELRNNERVKLELFDPSPFGQKPYVTFVLKHEKDHTTVDLDFHNQIPRPWHLVVKFAGLPEWTRDLHRKDLLGLKRFVEEKMKEDDK